MTKYFIISEDQEQGRMEQDFVSAESVIDAMREIVKIRAVNQKKIRIVAVLNRNQMERALRRLEQADEHNEKVPQ